MPWGPLPAWDANDVGTDDLGLFADMTVAGKIRSPQYEAGTAGWEVDADGSAEFQNLIIQGRALTLQTNTVDLQVSASGNTWYYSRGSASDFQNTDTVLPSGDVSGVDYDYESCIRFASVTIPKSASISAATLSLYANTTSTATGATVVSAEDTDDASAATTLAEAQAVTAARTTATVLWTPSGWTAGTWYTSDDISTVIQEVVNRAGWVAGNAMNIMWGDVDNYAADTYRLAADSTGSTKAKLHVEYTTMQFT